MNGHCTINERVITCMCRSLLWPGNEATIHIQMYIGLVIGIRILWHYFAYPMGVHKICRSRDDRTATVNASLHEFIRVTSVAS